MDVGPIRGSRPTERRAASAPSQTPRQSDEPQSHYEPKPVHRATSPRQVIKEEKSTFKRIVLPIIIALAVILLAIGGWFGWKAFGAGAGAPAIDSSKYQAVFFTNGQVYFGKLQSAGNEYMKLTDIYYLQNNQSNAEGEDQNNPQQASTDQSNVQLIKLGDEIHGPEDAMVISKDQVLFYENLKTDGKVAQSIEQHKQGQ